MNNIEKLYNENGSFLVEKGSSVDKYLRRNFGGEFFSIKEDGGNLIYTSKNSIGAIKFGRTTYRFQSKVNDFFQVFRMLKKINDSDYKFKGAKSLTVFDPKTKIEIDHGDILIDQLIDIFITELWKIKRIGYTKNYNSKEENLKYLRGRLLINKNIRTNLIPTNFYNQYNQLTYKTTENVIVFKALEKLIKQPLKNKLRNKLLHFYEEFKQLTGINNIRYVSIPSYRQNRLNKHYQDIIILSEIFINESYLSNMSKGNNVFCNFLVKSDILFERYIFTLLKEILGTSYPGYSVEEQVALNHIPKVNTQKKGYLNMMPDIVVYDMNKNPKLIIDTKYVDITDANKLNNTNYYQMISYMFTLNLKHGSKLDGVLLAHGSPGNTYKINYPDGEDSFIYTETVDINMEEEVIKKDLLILLEKVLG